MWLRRAGCNGIMDATVQGKPFKVSQVVEVKVRDGKAGPERLTLERYTVLER